MTITEKIQILKEYNKKIRALKKEYDKLIDLYTITYDSVDSFLVTQAMSIQQFVDSVRYNLDLYEATSKILKNEALLSKLALSTIDTKLYDENIEGIKICIKKIERALPPQVYKKYKIQKEKQLEEKNSNNNQDQPNA